MQVGRFFLDLYIVIRIISYHSRHFRKRSKTAHLAKDCIITLLLTCSTAKMYRNSRRHLHCISFTSHCKMSSVGVCRGCRLPESIVLRRCCKRPMRSKSLRKAFYRSHGRQGFLEVGVGDKRRKCES